MEVNRTSFDVRYKETDQMGVVHHSNYVTYCEVGRTELIKQLGFSYFQMEQDGYMAPVTNINLNYLFPAKYGDTITVETWIEEYNGVRVVYGYKITNQKGETCVTGTSTHAVVKKDSFKPISMRKHLPDWDKAYVTAMKKENE